MSKENKVRIQFDFTPDAVAGLDELVELSGCASRAELVRKALVVYNDLMEMRRKYDADFMYRYQEDGLVVLERVRFV